MQRRAYSILEVKSVDEDQRVIEGIATTVETDRLGDIVEPKGAEFKLPIPLLWQHDSRSPIGEVFAATVTKDGIRIKARIAKIEEPGTLKNRLDEAWQSLKAGLVRGLSIGFQSIEHTHIDGTFGIRFIKWLWLELSAVTIPANAGASILAIKQYDAPHLAAIGRSSLGASSSSPDRRSKDASRMKTLTEYKTALADRSSRLEELMKVADPDEDQQTELDSLPAEIKSLTDTTTRMQVLENAKAAVARPIGNPSNFKDASNQRGGNLPDVGNTTPNRPKEMGYVRAILCKAGQYVTGRSAVEIAKERYPDDQQVILHLKSAVAAGVTTDAAWAGNLVYPDNLVNEFIEFLRPRTIIGQFGTGNIPSLRRVPFNVRMGEQTAGGTGYWVGQSLLKPVTRLSTGVQSLGFAKAAALAVISRELARFSSPSAEAKVRDDLTASVREVLDRTFIDPDAAAVSNVSPASITRGITPLTSSGTDAAALRADIAQLLSPLIAANIDPVDGVFITTTSQALQISLMRNPLGQKEFPDLTMRGGMLEGFPVIASQYALSGSPESNLLIFVNASDVFLADDGGIDVMVSDQASIKMASDPNGADASAAYVSMFQSNQLAILAERYITWARRRDESVQLLNNVAYTSGSPA